MAEMSEREREPGEHEAPTPQIGDDVTSTDEGFLHLTADNEQTAGTQPGQSLIRPDRDATITTQQATQSDERAGTVEHLAAQRSFPPLDTNSPEIKAHLSALRTEMIRLLTDLRWEGYSVEEIVQRLVRLLNVGPVIQWQNTLVPFLYEIDRTGTLLPTWLTLLDSDDLADLPAGANPAETPLGRARRYAILLLGKYRTMGIRGESQSINLPAYLGKLALDPNVSMYATEALVKQATIPSMQALIEALKEAKGWAKVDVVEGCLAFKQERFFDMVVDSGLENAPGLESYIALPIYRVVPLEQYFTTEQSIAPRLQANAALIFQRVLRDSITPPTQQSPLPPLFTRPLVRTAQSLFAAAQRDPTWPYAVTLHTLGVLLGRYWSEISRQSPLDGQIIDQVYQVLPLMNDVERWMAGPGRDVLLQAISDPQETNLAQVARTLGELRDPRATSLLIQRLEQTPVPRNRAQALIISAFCSALSSIGERRSAQPMLQMVNRSIDIARRSHLGKRSDNLPYGDPAVAGSIIYAAAIRAAGQLGDHSTLEQVWRAANDFDPYVRMQALDALALLDPQGETEQSRRVAREALSDPRTSIVKQATQLILRYHDLDAVPILRRTREERPELSILLQETVQALGQ